MDMPTLLNRQEPAACEILKQVERVDNRDRAPGAVRGAPQATRHAVINENRVRPSDVGEQFLDKSGFYADLLLRQSQAWQDLDVTGADLIAQPDTDARQDLKGPRRFTFGADQFLEFRDCCRMNPQITG